MIGSRMLTFAIDSFYKIKITSHFMQTYPILRLGNMGLYYNSALKVSTTALQNQSERE